MYHSYLWPAPPQPPLLTSLLLNSSQILDSDTDIGNINTGLVSVSFSVNIGN